MREIRTSGLMSGEGRRIATRHRASPRLYQFHFPRLLPAQPFQFVDASKSGRDRAMWDYKRRPNIPHSAVIPRSTNSRAPVT